MTIEPKTYAEFFEMHGIADPSAFGTDGVTAEELRNRYGLPSMSAADIERDLDLPAGSINTDPNRYSK